MQIELFTWEKLDKVKDIKAAFSIKKEYIYSTEQMQNRHEKRAGEEIRSIRKTHFMRMENRRLNRRMRQRGCKGTGSSQPLFSHFTSKANTFFLPSP